jgi:hypothetical protein
MRDQRTALPSLLEAAMMAAALAVGGIVAAVQIAALTGLL